MRFYMFRTVSLSIIRSFFTVHSNGICHTGLLTACEQDQDETDSDSKGICGTIRKHLKKTRTDTQINPLNPELNPICYLLALLPHHFLHVSRIRVKSLTVRLLMLYIYGAPILDVSRSHTTTQHSR